MGRHVNRKIRARC